MSNNPSIFPTFNQVGDVTQSVGGMTLRDFFAAAAMQSYIATRHPDISYLDVAEKAYRAADAMLIERNR